MGDTTAEIDVYDFASRTWSTLDTVIPTERAGLFLAVVGEEILAMGGEEPSQKRARNEVEALNTRTLQWRTWPSLLQGRHGTGAVPYQGRLYVASGSGNIGGGPELTTQESIAIEN